MRRCTLRLYCNRTLPTTSRSHKHQTHIPNRPYIHHQLRPGRPWALAALGSGRPVTSRRAGYIVWRLLFCEGPPRKRLPKIYQKYTKVLGLGRAGPGRFINLVYLVYLYIYIWVSFGIFLGYVVYSDIFPWCFSRPHFIQHTK